MRTALLFMALAFCSGPIFSQETFTVSGLVTDSISKEHLSTVTIKLRKAKDTLSWNTVTSNSGKFIFNNVTSGKYVFQVSHVGYQSVEKEIVVSKDDHLAICLLRSNTILSNVTVLSEKKLVTHTPDKITYNV